MRLVDSRKKVFFFYYDCRHVPKLARNMSIPRGIFRYSSASDASRAFRELFLNFRIPNGESLAKLHLEFSSILDLFYGNMVYFLLVLVLKYLACS